MSDIYNTIKTAKDKSDVVKNNKVAKFAYTDAAYTGDIANGVSSYDFAAEQNVPLASGTDLNETVLSKGVRSQAASLPRNSINHFFGRVSYNLNKVVDWINLFMVSMLRSIAMNGSRYTATTPYQQFDTCTFVDDTTDNKVRYFVRFSVSPAELIGAAPLIGGVVNTTHWRELNAPLISPAFTGVPTAPTASLGTNNTQIATTAFSKAAIDAHNAETSVHGATALATASRMILRDAAGRAKVAAPSADEDIARKDTVDAVGSSLSSHIGATAAGVHGSASAATVNTLIHRDAAGRAKITAPAAADDIARKDTVDAVGTLLSNHEGLSSAHNATSAETASRIMMRDAAGRSRVNEPIALLDIATRSFVEKYLSRLTFLAPVRVATTANITLSATQTIDGIALVIGNRVLVKNQSTPSQNGVWLVQSAGWTRATDFDTNAEILDTFIEVSEGTVNNGKIFVSVSEQITVGTTAISFVEVLVSTKGHASKFMLRDSAGRSQVATPSAAADIATKGYADGLVGSGSIPIMSLNINGGTASAAIADANLIIIDQGANGTNRKSTFTQVWAWIVAKAVGAVSTILTSNLTASRALHSDGSGKVAVSAATATELGYLSGVTSAIQTQITSHNGLTNPHSATNLPTALRLVLRDSAGRAQFYSPLNASDAATKGYVDTFDCPTTYQEYFNSSATYVPAAMAVGEIRKFFIAAKPTNSTLRTVTFQLPAGGSYLIENIENSLIRQMSSSGEDNLSNLIASYPINGLQISSLTRATFVLSSLNFLEMAVIGVAGGTNIGSLSLVNNNRHGIIFLKIKRIS
jgi:hypothetical protein